MSISVDIERGILSAEPDGRRQVRWNSGVKRSGRRDR